VKNTLLAVATSVMCLSAQAQSTEKHLATSSDYSLYQVGQVTLGRNNGIVALSWFKYYDQIYASNVLQLAQVHCPTGMYRVIRSVEIVNGYTTHTGAENWNQVWENPVPGTFSQFYTVICPRNPG